MKKQPAIIAIIITAVGLAVTAPYSQAAGPTDQIPGLSQPQQERQEARLEGVNLCCSQATVENAHLAAFSKSHLPKSTR